MSITLQRIAVLIQQQSQLPEYPMAVQNSKCYKDSNWIPRQNHYRTNWPVWRANWLAPDFLEQSMW